MLGSLFTLEFLRGRRQGRFDLLCRVYTAWLVVQWTVLCLIYLADIHGRLRASPAAISRFVTVYLEVFVVQQFLLLILVTPAFLAGAVADERTTGTLALLLTTRLTAWEVIAGKLFGRLAQLGYLALVGMPFLCFMGGYGHLKLLPLLALPAVSVGLAFALGAASLVASVRSAHTRDAVVRAYLWCALGLGIGWGLAWGLGRAIPALPPGSSLHAWLVRASAVLHWLSPPYVLEIFWESSDPATLAGRVLTAVVAWGVFGVAFLGLAVWRFRPASLRLLEGPRPTQPEAWRPARPPVTDEPVRWKECMVPGAIILAGGLRVPRWLGAAAIFGLTLTLSWTFLRDKDPSKGFLAQSVGALVLFSLVAGIRTAGVVSGERERQTWDTLLLMPLATWEIVSAKLRGIADALYPYVLAYLVPALALAAWAGAGTFLTTAALAVAMLAGMYYLGATGLWWSAQSHSSWRSLVATLASGYGAAFALLLAILVGLSCLSAPMWLVLKLCGVRGSALGLLLTITGSLGVAALWLRQARRKVADAEYRVDVERNGPTFGRVLARALRKYAEQHPRK